MTPHRPQHGTSHKRLYGDSRHPYYVVAPDYQRSSAGIRVMHQFCAALRMCGQEAWMSTGVTGPLLGTPKLTTEIRQQHMEQGRVPIAVYPEVIGRNPLHCHVVSRYILNKPGLLGEKPQYKDSDLLFVYEPELLTEAPSPWGVLHLPSIDTSVFHNRDNPDDQRRHGWCVYAGRHAQGLKEHPALFADCTVITRDWPSTREDMAALFRRSEGVYCFENTAISMEARLCGCPVVQLPSKLYDPAQFFGSGLGLAKGISFSTDSHAVEAARAELIGLSAGYEALEDQFWQGLDQWIHDTQALAQDAARTPRSPILDDTPPDDPTYRSWYQLNATNELHAQHLATRMIQEWVECATVQLLITLQPETLNVFKQTLESLHNQLFNQWMLTIVSTEPKPTYIPASDNIQWLQARDSTHLSTIAHEMAKASKATWISFLHPGISLDPLALQALIDAGEAQPCWEMIYCDDDIQTKDGRAYASRLKPKLDLLTLCGADLIDGLTLIRQRTYCREIKEPFEGYINVYAIALNLAKSSKPDLIGHVNGVWAHLNDDVTTSDSESARLTAESVIADYIGSNSKVLLRGTGNLKIVIPQSITQRLPVAILMLGEKSLEDCIAQWRAVTSSQSNASSDVCYIGNRYLSPTDSQMLKAVVNSEPKLLTEVINLQGLNEGDALAELCVHVVQPLVWVLGEDTIPAQADTLDQLLAWIDWPDTVAVQSGLFDKRFQSIVCPGFSPALAYLSLPLKSETIGNAPTQQRCLSGLNRGGFLMKTPHLRDALQYMSPVNRSAWWLALSAHLTRRGQLIVWKPEAICLTGTDENSHPPILDDLFVERNLKWLTSDVRYNPHLSLRQPTLVDPQRSVPWVGFPNSVKRFLMIQEEMSLFPQENLKHFGCIGEYLDASVSLWTVCASDSDWTLMIEIVRSKPDAIYFSELSLDGTLSRALNLLEKHAPTIQRVCCVQPPSSSSTELGDQQLLDWLIIQRRGLRHANKVLTTLDYVAEALSEYHNNVQTVPLTVCEGEATATLLANLYLTQALVYRDQSHPTEHLSDP